MDVDFAFSPSVRNEFAQHLQARPNCRRISQIDRDSSIEWLTDSTTQSLSQQEYSRRNYVRRTFAWDAERQVLLSLSKREHQNCREVVTEDKILDVVEQVHRNNEHAGWDATWKDINGAYYGILREDVIFLLKRCHVCARNPRKRPKGGPMRQPESAYSVTPYCLNIQDLLYDEPNPDDTRSEEQPKE